MNKKKAILVFVLIIVFSLILAAPVLAGTKKKCAHKGCNKTAMSYSSYCNLHGCMHYGCGRARINGRCYCSTHAKDSKKSSSSSKKKNRHVEMPDCDDYVSWGEFMDDWDGKMPDGSDASDYWDNW